VLSNQYRTATYVQDEKSNQKVEKAHGKVKSVEKNRLRKTNVNIGRGASKEKAKHLSGKPENRKRRLK
jgi:peptide methionine sulfoxide reductase MsrA